MTLSEQLTRIRHLAEAKQDPSCILLLGVVAEPCPGYVWAKDQVSPGCPHCSGTGHVTRFWDDMPDGALEGAFIKALEQFAGDNYGLSMPGALHSLLISKGDTREAACALVIAWLGREKL